MDTVNASVSSRMNNYGIMRAVGMSGKQLKKNHHSRSRLCHNWLHRFFYGLLVTSTWGAI